MSKLKTTYVILISVIITTLFCALLYFFLDNPKTTTEEKSYRSTPIRYSFLSTQVDSSQENLVNFVGLRQDLNDYFKSENIDGSLYFEYLPTGSSIRINSNEDIEITDLLKVPIAMELYKSAELGLVSLNRPIDIKPSQLSGSGETWESYSSQGIIRITLELAAQRMLQDNDESAKNIIVDSIANLLNPEDSVFNDIDATYSGDEGKAQFMNSKSYSSILKCLYYSCSLSPENSNKILSLLVEAPEAGGLKQSLEGESIMVATKANSLLDGVQSDCGIFYLENRDYLLCIFLRKPTVEEGVAQDDRTNYFRNISKQVFEFVNNSRR